MAKKFYPQLEGIRGIAVVLVLISHWIIISYFPAFRFLRLGFIGVNVFFVLSGFLISEILIAEIEKNKAAKNIFKNFYIKRVLRIFPIYYLAIIILVIFNISESRDILLWTSTYTLNIAQNWQFGISDSFYMHIWSLCVEEQFYIVWPFILILTPAKNRIPVLSALIIFSIGFKFLTVYFNVAHAIGLNHSSTLASIDALGLGGLLASIKNQKQKVFHRISSLPNYVLPVLVLSFFSISYFTEEHFILNEAFFRFITAMIGVLVIAKGIKGDTTIFGRVLCWSTLRFLGKVSYGIYLYHWFVSSILKEKFTQIWSSIDFGFFQILYYQQYLGSFIFYFTITILLATVSYYAVEKPFLNLKKKFSS